MTLATFSIVITIFLYGAIFDIYIGMIGELERQMVTWKTIYTHRAFSTVIATALVWYAVVQFALTAVTAFILLGFALVGCMLLVPTKRKIQQMIAERRSKKDIHNEKDNDLNL